MTVKELDPLKIQQLIDFSTTEIQANNKKLDKISTSISELANKKNKLEGRITDLVARIAILKEAQVIYAGISGKIRYLRDKILAEMERAKRKDITIGEKEALDAEIKVMKQNLQNECGHGFLFNYPGYVGSYAYDYDDCRYGVRICIVCGFSEGSKNTKESIYQILTRDDGRVIKQPEALGKKYDPFNPSHARLEDILDAMLDNRLGGILSKTQFDSTPTKTKA